MTVSLVNAQNDGLFQTIGAGLAIMRSLNAQLNTAPPAPSSCWSSGGANIVDIGSAFTALYNTIPSSNLPFIDGIWTMKQALQSTVNSSIQATQTFLVNYLINVVNADTPLAAPTLANAMTVLIAQMTANSQTVRSNTVSASIAAGSSNVGTTQVLCSTVNANGTSTEYAFPEILAAVAPSDQNSGATAGSEGLTITGTAGATSALAWNWPLGSGATASATVVNPILDASGGNALTNSGFDTFSNNVPASWLLITGTPGGTIQQSTSITHSSYSAASLQIIGNGSELTQIKQQFNSSSGTATVLTEQQVLALCGWIKASSTPGAGVLVIDLCDGSGTTINNSQGTPNSLTITLTTLTTAWITFSAWFETPINLPSTVYLRMRLTTALSNAVSVYIDDMALANNAVQLYVGGPWVAAFRGTTDIVRGDDWSITVSNTMQNFYGVQANGKFQSGFEVLFAMRESLNMQLPSSATPTIGDGWIV